MNKKRLRKIKAIANNTPVVLTQSPDYSTKKGFKVLDNFRVLKKAYIRNGEQGIKNCLDRLNRLSRATKDKWPKQYKRAQLGML